MGGWVVELAGAVARPCQQFAFAGDDGPDRDLSSCLRGARFFKGDVHEALLAQRRILSIIVSHHQIGTDNYPPGKMKAR